MTTVLRSRIDGWFLSRRPPSDQLELTQRNVYILPTRAGWLLAGTLLVLLVASINYQLNLGYLLTFMLAGCVAVGMHVCHGTLRGLAMHLVAPDAQYAGAAAVLRVVLHNTRRSVRYGIGMAVRGSGQWSWSDVPAQGSATVEVPHVQVHVAHDRPGRHAVPRRLAAGSDDVLNVQRPRVNCQLAGVVLPGRPRPVGVDLDAESVGVVEVERLADEMVGGADRLIDAREMPQELPEGSAAGKQDGVVKQTEMGSPPYRIRTGSLDQLDQRRARHAECGPSGAARVDAEAEHSLIPPDRAVEVGHLQAHCTHMGGGGKPVALR